MRILAWLAHHRRPLRSRLTTCLRFVDDFRNIPWALGFLACTMTGLLLIEIASRSVAMDSPYVVWGGIGAIGD